MTPADDGSIGQVHYRITVGADTRTVTALRLRTGEVWDLFPDALGTGSRQVRDVLHNVVRLLASMADRTAATSRTGWHPDPAEEGRRVYVRADGRTVPEGRPLRLVSGIDPRVPPAAAPYPGPAPTADRVRADLGEIIEHGGWAPLVAIATAARSLGQSIRPVPAALLVTGDPGTGKSCCVSAARSLVLKYQFPPISTVRFGDTATDLEMRLDAEADMPALLDDLALTADAGGGDVAEANRKLEKVIRSLGNNEQMRGRRNQDLEAQTARYVRSPVMITAQMLPRTMQASLYRRSVLLYLRKGHGDAQPMWWKHKDGDVRNAARVAPSLRVIGDRIIDRLASADNPESILDGADQTALDILGPLVTERMPDWQSADLGLEGVVTNAAALLGGLVLVAHAAGVDPRPLVTYVGRNMVSSLVRQRAVMEDRNAGADDLGTALGDVLRAAIASGRAHVRNGEGKLTTSVPGRSLAELGISSGAGGDLVGRGLPLYWLPDRSALGVRSEVLHTLCASSGDPRVIGYTVRSLPDAVLRAGACHRSTQKGRASTTKVRVGEQTSKGEETSTPLVLVLPHLIWPDLAETDGDDTPAPPPAPEPTPESPEDAPPPPPALFPLTPEEAEQTETEGAQLPEAGPEESGPTAPEEAPAAAPVLSMAFTSSGGMTQDGEPVPVDYSRGMAAFLDLVASRMPEGGSVAIDKETAALLGYPEKAWTKPKNITKKTKVPAAVTDAEAGDWIPPKKGLFAWSSWYGIGRPSISIAVVEWLETHAEEQHVSGTDLLNFTDTPAQAATLLAMFRERMGTAFRMTAGNTGTILLRDHLRERKTQNPIFLWTPGGTPAVDPVERDCRWARPLTPEEEAARYAHGLDARLMYLSAMGTAEFAVSPPIYSGPTLFDHRRIGYWLVPNEEYRAWPGGPLIVTSHPNSDGMLPVSTPTMKLLMDLEKVDPMEEYDAYLPPAGETGKQFMKSFAKQLEQKYFAASAGVSGDPERERVSQIIKDIYSQTVGMFRRGNAIMKRADWNHTVVGTARANLLRKAIEAHKVTGIYPAMIRTDCLWYVTDKESPADLGIWFDKEKAKAAGDPAPVFPRGNGMGDYRHEKTLTMDEFRQKIKEVLK